MKKLLSAILTILLLSGTFSVCSFADTSTPTSASVYVTIADKGSLKVVREAVTVTDIDNDEALTINDALYCAHELKYEGGSEAGYASYEGDYGLAISKLWGDTSGNFGYYLNNASAWSLTDAVKDGDYVYAWVYAGSYNEGTLESYSYFDVSSAEKKVGGELTLTLSVAGYDEEWNPISTPLANATITVNGEETAYKTDADGKVTLTLDKAGKLIISAISSDVSIVPPVCVVNSTAAQNSTQDTAANTKEDTTAPAESESSDEVTEDSGCMGVVGSAWICVLGVSCVTAVLTSRRKNEE